MSVEERKQEERKDKQKGNGKKAVEFKRFFQVHLTPEHEDDIAAWLETDLQIFDLLSELIKEGYKVSLSEVNEGASYVCSVYDNRPSSTDAGMGFSSWGGSPADAAAVAYYKHRYVIGERTFEGYEAEATYLKRKKRFS